MKNNLTNIKSDNINKIDWKLLQNEMKNKFGSEIYDSWLKKIDLVDEFKNYVLLSVSTRFIRDWITSRYLDQILQIIKLYKKDISRIEFVINENIKNKNSDEIKQDNSSDNEKVSFIKDSYLQYNRIDPNKNFENFLLGKSNKLAFEAAKKVSEQIAHYNPLYIYGGVGMGKTHLLNAIGLPTLQGYGLTETSPVVSCNPIDDIRIETVGIPFNCNQVKIADDGEILVKGENVMLGYWNNNEETKKVLIDGWLHTGDIGKFDNNYLKITDRKKDIIITPGGDNISPLKIENMLTSLEMIDQAIVYGDNKPYLVALLILNKEFEDKKDNLEKEIENINKNLMRVEKIKKYFLIKENFTIENGMMTPTLKLKRFKIINKYKNEFEKLY